MNIAFVCNFSCNVLHCTRPSRTSHCAVTPLMELFTVIQVAGKVHAMEFEGSLSSSLLDLLLGKLSLVQISTV